MSHVQTLFATLPLTLLLPLGATVPAYAQDATATPAATPSPAAFVWEATGGDQALSYPMDVTLDPQGNVWVVDMGNAQFQIFSPDGEFLEGWGREGDGPGEFRFFAGPIAWETDFGGDVAFDREGNIYVADLANARVQKFAPDRTFLTEWGGEGTSDGQFLRPWSLDVDAQGNVYVADYSRNDVQVFSSDGAYLRTLVGSGSGKGELISAASVVVAPDGMVWVSDYDGTLLAFTPEGELLGEYGRYGVAEGQFSSPNVGDVADGYVYVADAENNRVQVFDAAGWFIAGWGSQGEGPGEFNGPVGVALDGHGNAYVADIGNHRIQKFRLQSPLTEAATPTP